jgi:hypothetical protein
MFITTLPYVYFCSRNIHEKDVTEEVCTEEVCAFIHRLQYRLDGEGKKERGATPLTFCVG